MKPTLNIWLYYTSEPIYAHDDILTVKESPMILNTYDTSFFSVSWLDKFDDILIHWMVGCEQRSTSVKELLANQCPYVHGKNIRPVHNLGRIFWGKIYSHE